MGLMSKTTVVVVPFLLLLLDLWPLRRVEIDDLKRRAGLGRAFRLVAEKIPLLAVALSVIAVSMMSFKGHHGSTVTAEMVPYALRIENALVSYVKYLQILVWPSGLTVHHPYPVAIPGIEAAGAAFFLACLSGLALFSVKKAPFVLVGWLWFLGALVPMSGLVQVGLWPAFAERWAYLPAIGVFMAVAWAVPEILTGFRFKKQSLALAAGLVIVVFSLIAYRQAGFWRDDLSLFSHALAVEPANSVALSCMGDYYMKVGLTDKAISFYRSSLEINPGDPTALTNMGIALIRAGRLEEAQPYIRRALAALPSDPQLHRALGIALAGSGRIAEALESFSRAVALDPNNPDLHVDYALVLARASREDEALSHYARALRLDPNHPAARRNMAEMLIKLARSHVKRGEYDKAVGSLMKSLELMPDDPELYYNIACVMALRNDKEQAMAWLEKAFLKGFSDLDLVKKDRDLDTIRSDRRFQALVAAQPSSARAGK